MHWIVVADAARARIFSADELFDHLEERHDLVHPANRLPGREIDTDGPGRSRGATIDEHDPHEAEQRRFAKEVAEALKKGIDDYERLVLVAPPKFLGLLRQSLDKPVARKVVGEIHKDLSKVRALDLPPLLRDNLPPEAQRIP